MVRTTQIHVMFNNNMNWKWFLFSFEGRISRKPFWIFNLVSFAVYIIFVLIFDTDIIMKKTDENLIFMLIITWPALAVQAKRWHDIDKSAWWILINFIPLIGTMWALTALGLREGNQGENKYGKDPLEGVDKSKILSNRSLTTKEVIFGIGLAIILMILLFSTAIYLDDTLK